jgi:hypothetical protein
MIAAPLAVVLGRFSSIALFSLRPGAAIPFALIKLNGDQPDGTFLRLWFNGPISPEVSFDSEVYLLKRERAKTLRTPSEPVKPRRGQGRATAAG